MKRSEIAIALLCYTTALALYIRTLAPGLLYGDSAEFQTIAYTLGVGHPTGYPVYVMLAKAFTLLPIGEIAYRVNLFSAFCAAVAVAFVYLIARELGCGHASSIFASVLLAWTPLFWRYAAIAEVYALSSAWLTLIVFVMLRWAESRKPHWLLAAGILGGLSLGVHTMIVLAAPAIVIYLAISSWSAGEKLAGSLKPALLGILIGLVIFLLFFFYLDRRNSPAGYYNTVALPSLSVWGMTASDFDSSLERLAFLYFPPQFRGQFFAIPLSQVSMRLADFIHDYYAFLIFSLVGILSLFIPLPKSPHRPLEGWFFITALITSTTFAVTYNVADFFVFYMPSILILVICAARGIQSLVSLTSFSPKYQRLTTALTFLVFYLVAIGPLAVDVPPALRGRTPPSLEENQMYGFQFPGNYKLKAEKVVNSIEDDAILFTDWDRVYDLYYVAHVLQGRVNMDFHEIHFQKEMDIPLASMLSYIDENIDNRPIYFTKYPLSLAEAYNIIPANSDLFKIERK